MGRARNEIWEDCVWELVGPSESDVVVESEAEYAEEDSRAALAQSHSGNARILESLPGDLENHALMGIERCGLDRSDRKERRIERAEVLFEEAPTLRDRLVRCSR